MHDLTQLAKTNKLADLIVAVRAHIAADRRAFADPDVKAWCARRWRFLFLNEAVKDPIALRQASGRFFNWRSPRRRIAEYYLVGADTEAWRDEQPEPAAPAIRNTTFLACPGLLNGLLPVRDFQNELPRIEKRFPIRVLRADSHPVRGCEANVADLLRALNEGKGRDAAGGLVPDDKAIPPGDVALIGYSKGAPDILTLLVQQPAVAAKVRCVFTWAGAIGGSQVADEAAKDYKKSKLSQELLEFAQKAKLLVPPVLHLRTGDIRRIDEFDTVGAVRDLTTEVRGAFLAANKDRLDALGLPMFYLRGATRKAEVPLSQRQGFRMLSKFDPQNDMQVTAANASLPFPMATDLGVLRGHHWDLAYPAFRKRRWLNNTYHPFPKEAALYAMVSLGAELGLID